MLPPGNCSNAGVKLTVWRMILLLLFPAWLGAAERSFWVWNRATPLDAIECAQLHTLGIRTLYWEVAELENTDGTWRRKKLPVAFPETKGDFHIIPVIRLESSVAKPLADRAGLLAMIELARPRVDDLQIDYDCPDRWLGDYADVLAEIGKKVPHLSATALAGWVDVPGFSRLQAAAGELVPMFYDLKPDTASALIPLVEPGVIQRQLERWRQRCQTPWRAGLPWFARVSLYDKTGRSRGHIRRWSWDDICFNRDLATVSPTSMGMTVLKATAATSIGSSAIAEGETLVVRWPDLGALAAAGSDAPSIVYFRLPNGAPEGGWSLSQLRQLDQPAAPRLLLRVTPSASGEVWELVNDSDADLPPRLSGKTPLDRGYALEIDAPAPIFRDVEAGDFWRVTGHRTPDDHPQPVTLQLATRLTLWFSALPARQSLRIGQFQLAPNADRKILRYQVLNAGDDAAWRDLP